MFPIDDKKRPINYPLNRSLSPSVSTPTNTTNPVSLDWKTTDNDEQVTITLTLSLNEYIALASCVDVGSDIAYGDSAILLWWIWVRSINTMDFCEQVNDCIDTNSSTQLAISNMLNSTGLVNPDMIDPSSPEMNNRFPVPERQTDSSSPPPSCDKDALWAGILEQVTRLDTLGRDFLEQIVAQTDAVERIADIIDVVPLFGDIVADVITLFSETSPDLLNAYNAHSTQTVLEDTACALFEIVCQECRYPTFDEFIDEYSSAGVSGMDDIAAYGVTALMDYMTLSNNLGNAVVWYTIQTAALNILYLGGTWLGLRGTSWLGIWANVGEATPTNAWQALCDGCGWSYTFDFVASQNIWVLNPDGWGSTYVLGTGWVTNDTHDPQAQSYDQRMATDIIASFTSASFTSATIQSSKNGGNTNRVLLIGYLLGVSTTLFDSTIGQVSWNGNGDYDKFQIFLQVDGASTQGALVGEGIVSSLTVTGTGIMPSEFL